MIYAASPTPTYIQCVLVILVMISNLSELWRRPLSREHSGVTLVLYYTVLVGYALTTTARNSGATFSTAASIL